MLSKFIDTEIQYIKNFSKYIENENIIRFWDDRLEDMYSHNFTYIKGNPHINKLKEIILNELQLRKKEGKDFLRIEANFNISNELVKTLPIPPKVSSYDFMYIETQSYNLLRNNPNCFVSKADTTEKLTDGINVDVLANEPHMGIDFAKKRINRKSEVYTQQSSNLNLYVCYYKSLPIGDCELFINDKVAKIEDFDIVEEYQRRGFGTSVLKHLLKESNESNIDIAYLITDSSDTAKEMYKKCGFNKAGKKTELFFNLKGVEKI